MKTYIALPTASLLAILGFVGVEGLSAQTAPATGAQTSVNPESSNQEEEDLVVLEQFVVTGTQIRGVEPVGTKAIVTSQMDIIESGAMDANEALTRIPQVTSAFNQAPALSSTDPGNSVLRPQLRNFTPVSASSNTLVIFDGHRIVNAGGMNAPDPGYLPPIVIQSIDVVPDGGSAIYGSDAVAGVINYITREQFDGTQIDARYGFAEGYWEADLNLITGKVWKDGGAYIALSFSDRDELMGRELDWFRQTSPNTGFGMPGTVILDDGTTYALPDGEAGSIALVDNTDENSFIPGETRKSVFASVNQRLSQSLLFDAQVYYTKRDSELHSGTTSEEEVTDVNPFFSPVADETSHTVRWSFGELLRNNDLESYGVTAQLKAELTDNWQLRAMLNYGHSEHNNETQAIDENAEAAALLATTPDTALNPYVLSETNPAVIESIFQPDRTYYEQEMKNVRIILDGSLFKIAGGDVAAAVGAEYTKEDSYFLTAPSPASVTIREQDRSITAYFGEVAIPLVGKDNSVAGIDSLGVSAAVRTDDYTIVGRTTNSKFGLTYKPIESVSFRANWGESFIAPGIGDTIGASDTRMITFSNGIGFPGIDQADVGTPQASLPYLFLAGGNADLKPQEAVTWSAGLDIEVPSVKGLTLSATYYNIETENEISNMFAAVWIPQGAQACYAPQYSNWVIKNPSIEFSKEYTDSIETIIDAGGGATIDDMYEQGDGAIYAIFDARRNNLSLTKQAGIDFSANYNLDTDFGSMNFNIGGSYLLKRDVATAPGAELVDSLDSPGMSPLNLIASVGAKMKQSYASATLRYSGGYDLNPLVGGQSHVGSFTTVDLYYSYKLQADGMLKDLTLSVGLNNVFDTDPPNFNGGFGYANGTTKGRLVQFGVSKKF